MARKLRTSPILLGVQTVHFGPAAECFFWGGELGWSNSWVYRRVLDETSLSMNQTFTV